MFVPQGQGKRRLVARFSELPDVCGALQGVSFAMQAGRMYHIAIEYRHRLSLALIRLLWKGPGVNNDSDAPSYVPSMYLFAPNGHIAGR